MNDAKQLELAHGATGLILPLHGPTLFTASSIRAVVAAVGTKLGLNRRSVLLIGTAFVLVVAVIISYWPRGKPPYYQASMSVMEALQRGDYNAFRQNIPDDVLQKQRLTEDQLKRVFHEFLVPEFQKCDIRLARKVDNPSDMGSGTAVYEATVPPRNRKVMVGSTSYTYDSGTKTSFEDVFLNAVAIISARKDDIKNPLYNIRRRVVEERTRLESMGMKGIARTRDNPRYFTWDEYLKMINDEEAIERG